MSTRGRIAIKENGKYTYIYNHCDSYIDGLGIILYKFYKDVNKVKGLISLGNTANVGPTVEEGGSKTYPQYITNALQEAIRLKKATNIYVYKKEKNILFYKLAAPKK